MPVKQDLLYDQGRDPNSKHRFPECRISLTLGNLPTPFGDFNRFIDQAMEKINE